MGVEPVSLARLAASYGLLLISLAILLYHRVPMMGETLAAIVRMTVQLLFVGLYLQVIFDLDHPGLNALWVLVMITVADVTILRSCRLKLRFFGLPVFLALLAGTAVPALAFLALILRRPHVLEAQYVVPIAGMILGNCLRADIIGVRDFYQSLRKQEKTYLQSLAQGAVLREALRPFAREAVQAALKPTVSTMATIGLVALPGMMTGVILGGNDPMTAIKYQIAIMIAIFTGTAITVFLALRFTARTGFNEYGVLERDVFRS